VILLSFPLAVIHLDSKALDIRDDSQDGKLSLQLYPRGQAKHQPMYSNESTSGPKPQFEMGKLIVLLEVMSADTLDKEGEDRFCHFVEKMPPVS